MRRILTLIASTLLAACSPQPEPANPALWHVEGPDGREAWLFGTIHSVKHPLAWETDAVRKALTASDSVMVEVGNLSDEKAVAATFARLAKSDAQPPILQRIPPENRPALAALLKRGGYADGDFAQMDTWAAALTLARIGASDDDSRNGVDRAVMERADGKPIVELEGAERQLGLFDSLPEADQRDLLAAVVTEAVGEEEAKPLLAMKKGQAADAAETLLAGRGWVPDRMRPAMPYPSMANDGTDGAE
jgi:uncharacterized protein YbaP (TraB family)